MLPYVIVSGERKLTRHSEKRSLQPVSWLHLAGVGGRIAMAHSSLFIKGILSKRRTGGLCHPSCAVHISGLILQMAKAYALA